MYDGPQTTVPEMCTVPVVPSKPARSMSRVAPFAQSKAGYPDEVMFAYAMVPFAGELPFHTSVWVTVPGAGPTLQIWRMCGWPSTVPSIPMNPPSPSGMCCPQETLTSSIAPVMAPVKTRFALPERVEAGAEGEGEGIAVGVGAATGLGDGEGDALGDGEGDALGDGEGNALGDGEGEVLGDGEAVGSVIEVRADAGPPGTPRWVTATARTAVMATTTVAPAASDPRRRRTGAASTPSSSAVAGMPDLTIGGTVPWRACNKGATSPGWTPARSTGSPDDGWMHRSRALRIPRRAVALLCLGVLAVALALAANQVRLASDLASRLTAPYRGGFGARPQDLAPSYEDVSFPSRTDHLTLRGWLLHTSAPTGRSVVLLHGTDADRAINAPLARDLVRAGYDVLMFDFRACGTSDGDHQTYGRLEGRDVLGAHDFMVARGYSPALMTFLGNSAGATALLRVAPQMPDIAAVVSDSAFDSAAPLLSTYWAHAGVSRPLTWLATQLTRLDGLDPDAGAAAAVRSMPSRAILFIHARGDQIIPYSDAETLRAVSANLQSRLWISAATHHDATYGLDPQAYLRTVLAFVDGQIAARHLRS